MCWMPPWRWGKPREFPLFSHPPRPWWTRNWWRKRRGKANSWQKQQKLWSFFWGIYISSVGVIKTVAICTIVTHKTPPRFFLVIYYFYWGWHLSVHLPSLWFICWASGFSAIFLFSIVDFDLVHYLIVTKSWIESIAKTWKTCCILTTWLLVAIFHVVYGPRNCCIVTPFMIKVMRTLVRLLNNWQDRIQDRWQPTSNGRHDIWFLNY